MVAVKAPELIVAEVVVRQFARQANSEGDNSVEYIVMVSCSEHGVLTPSDYEIKTDVHRGRKSENDYMTLYAICHTCKEECAMTFEED